MVDAARKFLYDMLQSAEATEVHLQGISTYEQYKAAFTAKRAVERELMIIGEALGKAWKEDPHIMITAGRNIIGLRNRIAHAYDSVDDADLWNIVQNHLPKLKTELRELLKD